MRELSRTVRGVEMKRRIVTGFVALAIALGTVFASASPAQAKDEMCTRVKVPDPLGTTKICAPMV